MRTLTVLKMDLKNIFLNPAWFIMNSLFPLAMTLILSYLMNPYYGELVSSIDYFAVTTLIFTASNATVMAANTFLEDRIKKPNLRIMYAPISRFAITFTKIFATFLYVGFYLCILGLIFHFCFNVSLGSYHFWFLLLSLCFCASSLGVMFASIFKSEETANMISSTFISLMAVLGGSFFMIPKFLQKISNVSFIKWVNDASFRIIYDHNYNDVFIIVGSLILISLIGIMTSNVVFKEEDYL